MKQKKNLSLFARAAGTLTGARRVAAVLLAVILTMTAQTAWAVWSGEGSGTSSNPYEISNYAELKEFANIVNGTGGGAANTSACAKLVDDIVCKNDPNDPGYATDWTPIGNYTRNYTGTFDGQGYTITGLSTPTNNTSDYVGLFGCVSSGKVRNVKIVDAIITGNKYVGGAVGASGSGSVIKDVVVSNSEITGQSHVGGVVGYNALGSVQTSCFIGSSSVGGNSTYNESYYGGIIGYNNGTLQNCYVAISGSISVTTEVVGNVGGIAGYNTGTIQNCHYSGSGRISCSSTSSSRVGGIVGINGKTVQYCYYAGTGEITASSGYVGGIIGNNFPAATNCYCYYNKEYATVTKAIGNADDTENVKGLTTAQFKDEDFLTTYSFSSDNWIQGVVAPLLKGLPYTISFKANGGEGSMDDQTVNTENADALSTNTFTRSGYHLKGWNTKADGTGIDIATNVQAKLVGPEKLYAQWCDANLEAHAAVPATCTEAGNSAYWECTVCHKYFSNEAGTVETTAIAVEIPATGHNLTAHAAVAATCTTAGNSAYWSCSNPNCGKYFSDEHGIDQIVANHWIIFPLGHNLIAHPSVAATCTTAGNSAYWNCSNPNCGKYFSDENGENEIEENSWEIPAGHQFVDGICTICGGTGGSCGEGVSWLLKDGILTISGSGAMVNYPSYDQQPWFERLDAITSVAIIEGVTSIGDNAFSNCTTLTSITIPASVTRIGINAFNGTGWYNAQPDGLLYLSNWLLGYKGNPPTGTLLLKEGTKGIAEYAFPFCNYLESFTIPPSVTSIGENAFYGSTSVKDVYCYADPKKLKWDDINEFIHNSSSNTKCHVFNAGTWWTIFGRDGDVGFVGDLGTSTCPVVLTEGDGVDLLTSLAAQTTRTDVPENLNVTFSRTFDANTNGEGKASTVCLPYAVAKPDASVGKFYTFGGVTEDRGEYTVTMNEMADATTTPGTPYLFKPADGGAVPFNGNITIAASYATGEPPSADGWEFHGTYEKLTWESGQTRLYGFAAADFEKSDGTLLNDVGAFRRFDWGYCDAFRCYLWAPDPNAARGATKSGNTLPQSMRVILVGADGTTTGIGTLDTKTGEVTFDSEAWYSLDGRRLSGQPSKKGVYIHNGKTVLVP